MNLIILHIRKENHDEKAVTVLQLKLPSSGPWTLPLKKEYRIFNI